MHQVSQFFTFVVNHRQELWEQTLEHLWLTFTSLLIAVIIGLVLGIWISRNRKVATPVLGFVNAIQTVPSIALLGFLLPFLGIGVVPAIVALFLYGLLPIVRNTYTGITEIDPSIRESAMGMGMSPRQVLMKVELPLAMPVLFAGIRTAFVINVGIATLCALIAAGGLGEFIFRGLSTNNPYMILAGAIPAALMALFFDALMGYIQTRITSFIKPLLIFVISALVVTFISLIVTAPDPDRLVAGFPSEFIERGDGYVGLQKTYDLDLDIREMEIGLMYDAVKNGNVDVISGFSTDGRIKAFDLLALEDDKNYFPPYHAAPLVRGEVLRKHPELKSVLEMISGKITDQQMAALNYQVDEEGNDIRAVAANFLKDIGLRTDIVRKGSADIVVGSKNFTESFILAEMFKIIIENYSSLTVDLRQGFGGTKLLFDALHSGAVDLYPEYTGTGLLVILRDEASQIRYEQQEVYEHVKKEFQTKYDITWLSPLGFNNTFALMMRREQAKALGITTISDLAGTE